jgi:hypothetical protein
MWEVPFSKKIVSTPRVAAWTHKDDRPDPGIGNKTAQAVASGAFFALYTGAVNVTEFALYPPGKVADHGWLSECIGWPGSNLKLDLHLPVTGRCKSQLKICWGAFWAAKPIVVWMGGPGWAGWQGTGAHCTLWGSRPLLWCSRDTHSIPTQHPLDTHSIPTQYPLVNTVVRRDYQKAIYGPKSLIARMPIFTSGYWVGIEWVLSGY